MSLTAFYFGWEIIRIRSDYKWEMILHVGQRFPKVKKSENQSAGIVGVPAEDRNVKEVKEYSS